MSTASPVPAPTAVQKQVKPFEVLKQLVDSPEFKVQIQRAAPKHLTADRQLRIILTAALGNPKIAECCLTPNGKASIIKACLTSTQRGLELDGRQAHLVPFNDRKLGMIVQLIVGYQGLVDLAYNHPKVKSIWWNVVHEKDTFEFEDGLERKLRHVKYDGEEEPGALRYAYAVCELDGGAKSFVVMNRREVMKAKSYSRGASSEYSPWQTNEAAMWGKTAVRALAKQIPQSAELRDALALDDEGSTLEEDRFRNAKPARVHEEPATELPTAQVSRDPETAADPELADAGLAPAEPPAPAPAAAKTQSPAAPARQTQPAPSAAPSPRSGTPEDLATLGQLCLKSGITENQVVVWASKTYRLSSMTSVQDILDASPRRIAQMVDGWEGIKEAVKATVAPENL